MAVTDQEISQPSATMDSLRKFWPVLVIIGAWVTVVLLVNTAGNWPVNDEWSFGPAVFQLAQTGHYNRNGFWPMILLGQIYLAYPFCLIFGNSYQCLRLLSQGVALIGLCCAYACLRFCRASKSLALLGTLTIMLNPVFVELSTSFMSDGFFLAFMSLSFLLSLQTLSKPSPARYLSLAAACLLATLVRQFGVIVSAAFSFTHFLKYGRGNMAAAILPLFCCLAAIALYTYFLPPGIGPRDEFKLAAAAPLDFFTHHKYNYAQYTLLSTAVYAFAFVLPVLIALSPPVQSTGRRLGLLWFGASLLLTLLLARWHMLVGSLGNAITAFGVGPLWIPGRAAGLPDLPDAVWLAVTLAGLFPGGGLVLSCARALKRASTPAIIESERLLLIFSLSILVMFQTAIIITVVLYDRYFLPLMLPLLVVAVLVSRQYFTVKTLWRPAISIVVVGLYGYFSIAAVHDYFASNRAGWRLTQELMAAGVAPQDIETMPESFACATLLGLKGIPTPANYRPAGRHDLTAFTFDPKNGKTIASTAFCRWLVPGQATLFAVRHSRRELNRQNLPLKN